MNDNHRGLITAPCAIHFDAVILSIYMSLVDRSFAMANVVFIYEY